MNILIPVFLLSAVTSLPIGSTLLYACFSMLVVFAVLFVIFLLIKIFSFIIARFIETDRS